MVLPWSHWCRLCSKDNDGCEVDIFTKENENENENNTALLKAIGKYFSISIDDNNGTPTKICGNCHRFIKNLQLFADRVTKVEMMFNELLQEKVSVADQDDIDSIRKQYGINCFEKCDQSTDTNDLINEKEKSPVVKSEPSEDHVFENYGEIDGNDDDSNVVPQDPVCVIIKTENDADEEETVEEQKLIKNSSGSGSKNTRKRKVRSKEVSYDETEENIEFNAKYYNETDEYESGDNDDDLDYEEEKKKKSRKKRQSRIKAEGERSQPKRKRERKTDVDRKEIKCDLCDKTFSRKSSCRYHMENVHALPQELNYECTSCGKKFATEKRLKSHEITHLPPDEKMMYPCPYCDKKFTKQVNINPHIRAVHIGEKSFICEECGKTFVTKGALKEHMYTHIEETPFQCSKCPKKFKNTARLKVHEDTHNGTVYVCPHCGLQLNTRRTLNMHMVIHSDKKKYKCEYCGNEYKRSKTLKNHLILHTGLRPYTCQFCDKTFANGSNCRSHKKKAHPVELAALEMAGEAITPTANIPRLDQLKAVAAQASPFTTIHYKHPRQQQQQQQQQQQPQQQQQNQQQPQQQQPQNQQQQQHQQQQHKQEQQLTPIHHHEQDSNISSMSFSQHSQQSSTQISSHNDPMHQHQHQQQQQQQDQLGNNGTFSFLNEAQRSAAVAAAAAVGIPSHHPFQGYHNLPREINEQMQQIHRQNIYEHLKLALS